jgi:hypothetical protein
MPAFVEFEIADDVRFERVAVVIEALGVAKRSDDFRDDDYWRSLFVEAIDHFWWPLEEELEDWERRWLGTPVGKRSANASLNTPWTLGSLIDAFRNGEYDLLGCRRVTDHIGRIEFDPWGWPYGGTGCMRAVLEAFGHRVTREEDA